MSVFEKIKKAFKAPETPSEKTRREMAERHQRTEAGIREGEEKRAKEMEQRRAEAEEKAIDQAQKDLRQLPERIAALQTRIQQLREFARGLDETAYQAQLKPGSEQEITSLKQNALVKGFEADAVEEEKKRLEVKLNEARRLLESRGLLETK